MNALELSKYIINKCVNDDHPISNLQLQKILYYIQRVFLQTKDTCAFFDDIEAWIFGPCVVNVYHTFCGFGAMPISESFDGNIEIKDEDKWLIDTIIESKRNLKPWVLVEETQYKDGAWDITYKNRHNSVISIYDITYRG